MKHKVLFQRLWMKLDGGAVCLFCSVKHYRNREVSELNAVQSAAAFHHINTLKQVYFCLFLLCLHADINFCVQHFDLTSSAQTFSSNQTVGKLTL